MLIYWLLFAYPAVLAFAYPTGPKPAGNSAGQTIALAGFVVFYTLLAGLRWDVGGDWGNYVEIYDEIALATLGEALTITDPLFGLVNWVSAQFDLGVYFVNGVCSFMLVVGVARIVGSLREPWLAMLMAVPYLLIVVGLGYIRQGAAIGLLLLAMNAYDRGSLLRTAAYLLIGVGFHSTAIMVFPLFALSLAQRHKIMALILAVVSVYAYFGLVVPRLDKFNAGYLEAELESTGAATRVLMSFLPSVLLLLRWRHFGTTERVRPIWLTIAIANIIAMAALFLTPSSTAVDRAALYFSVAQLAMFGEFRNLIPYSERMVSFVRILLFVLAALVQTVWLVYATNAEFWVPYKTLFEAF